jgi:hypothetical protein
MESNHHVLNHMNITCRDQIEKQIKWPNWTITKWPRKGGVKEVTL